ncbi:hypothetical protein F4780DRAFT_747049 [Xylariomycetidae sp. FL0641]|nr:hypothetical protein F4780DRAFT_747049 [Xylariomycetidae sp. FL0641]
MNTLLETGDSRRRQTLLLQQQQQQQLQQQLSQPRPYVSERSGLPSQYGENPRPAPPPPRIHPRAAGHSSHHHKHKRRSRMGRIIHHKQRGPVTVMVVDPNHKGLKGKSSVEKDLAIGSNIAAGMSEKKGDEPPAYVDSNDVFTLTNSMADLEAQRERVETKRFWILALPTIITGIGTVILIMFELYDMVGED